MGDVLTHVKKLGFSPKTVIDVGVAEGTFWLYETFPDSFHLLVEPLEEFRDKIEQILKKHKGKSVIAAAHSENGEIEINVHNDHLFGSSIMQEQMGSEFDGKQRKVPTVTLDSLKKLHNLLPPYLLKIDVQGSELNVLNGSMDTLKNTDLVLIEASLFQFMKNAPQFFDVVLCMKQNGFVAYDIYGGIPRPLDGALGQIDMAFVKENGMFRNNHSYATREQWRKIVSVKR